MASAASRFSTQLVRHSFRTRPRLIARQWTSSSSFHLSAARRDTDSSQSSKSEAAARAAKAKKGPDSSAVLEDEVVDYGEYLVGEGSDKEGFLQFPVGMPREEKDRALAEFNALLKNPPKEAEADVQEYRIWASRIESQVDREMEGYGELDVKNDFLDERVKPGLMNMGDEPHQRENDEPWEGDDITSLAHGELEQHREIRDYMRLAAWDMPLLHKYAKKFEPPGKDRPLRFRQTTYLGEEHPARHKVVLEFCTADLPLTPAQRLKLIKLVGQRYDPQQDKVRMSCEEHPSAAENKRHLGELMNTLLAEARNDKDDSFDDVPVDFRHVKWRRRLAFPEQWKLTPERRTALEQARREQALAEVERRPQLVNGATVLQDALQAQAELAAVNAASTVGAGNARSRTAPGGPARRPNMARR